MRYRLLRPDGTVYGDDTFDNTGQRYSGYRVKYSVKGSNGVAPMGGDWKYEVTLNGGPACTYAIKVDRLSNPLELTLSKTQFDPYYTYSVTVGWKLLQDVESTAALMLRLVTPNGAVSSTQSPYISSYSTSGTAYLSTPFCSRYSTIDTCQYGTYRIDVVRDGLAVAGVELTGFKP